MCGRVDLDKGMVSQGVGKGRNGCTCGSLVPPSLQVTTGGQFVFELDSDHKKPYETLVLGRVHSSGFPNDRPDLSARACSGGNHSHCGGGEADGLSSHGQCVVGPETEISARHEAHEEEEDDDTTRPCKVRKLDDAVSCGEGQVKVCVCLYWLLWCRKCNGCTSCFL